MDITFYQPILGIVWAQLHIQNSDIQTKWHNIFSKKVAHGQSMDSTLQFGSFLGHNVVH